ncbi:MAG: hypothetical protein M9920_11650 [Verrucomicrobiae bacterium]|nr:hypothetical protein [Verrucomicrobiae bacterium]
MDPFTADCFNGKANPPPTFHDVVKVWDSLEETGKVCLLIPDDEGVFFETQTIKDPPLASDAQIYLDLQNTGLRGPEQANALRHWEGFCRP